MSIQSVDRWPPAEKQEPDLRRVEETWQQVEKDLEILEALLALRKGIEAGPEPGYTEEIQRSWSYLQAGYRALEEAEKHQDSIPGFVSGRTLAFRQRIEQLRTQLPDRFLP